MTSARFGPVDPYCPTLPHAVGRAVGPGAGALADGPHSPGPACPDHDRDAERPNRSPPPRPGSGPVSPMPSARSGCAGSMPTVWRGLTIACPPGAPARTARRCAPRSLPWPSRSRRRSGTRLRCPFTLWTLERLQRAFREREGTRTYRTCTCRTRRSGRGSTTKACAGNASIPGLRKVRLPTRTLQKKGP